MREEKCPTPEEEKKRSFMETQPLEALKDELLALPGQKQKDLSHMETQPLEALEEELKKEQEKVEVILYKEQCEFIRKLVQKHEELSFDAVLRAILQVMQKLPWEKFPASKGEEEFAKELEKLLGIS